MVAPRWPAFAVMALFLTYAAGKAVYATQGQLGFPGGPPVSAAETESYFLDATTAQWLASASGVLGAGVALVTILPLGRALPRRLMLVVLGALLLAVTAGGGILALDGFLDLGIGWRWYHGVLGILVIGLCLLMTRSYFLSRRRLGAQRPRSRA